MSSWPLVIGSNDPGKTAVFFMEDDFASAKIIITIPHFVITPRLPSASLRTGSP
jgi:hypothetical protein